jgi:hypothetical protein
MSPGALQAKDSEEGPPRNEHADIGLVCLHLFMVGQRALAEVRPPALSGPTDMICTLGELIPVTPPAFRAIRIIVPTTTIVRVNRSLRSISTAASYENLLSLKALPCAWKNLQRSPGPDSLLLLQLVDPAPASLCCPYKKKKANLHTLAVLIQSKQRRSLAGRKQEDKFDEELRKCRRCPFPFLFIMISDSECSLPDKANAVYVGQERLELFYGSMLCALRKEEWHTAKPNEYEDDDAEEPDDEPEMGEMV